MKEIQNEKFIEKSITPISIKNTENIIFQMKNCICKIYKEDGSKGTGFFCNIPFPNEFNLLPVLVTNDHILEEKDIKNDKIIEFQLMMTKKRKEL